MVLAGVKWISCLVYIDDIIIMGKTFQQHVDNLGLVLEMLRGTGLKVKPSKCFLCHKVVLYLGHKISSLRIQHRLRL